MVMMKVHFFSSSLSIVVFEYILKEGYVNAFVTTRRPRRAQL